MTIAPTQLIRCIQDALGTAETGDALIEVARNAHKAEQELAAYQQQLNRYSLTCEDAVKLTIFRLEE